MKNVGSDGGMDIGPDIEADASAWEAEETARKEFAALEDREREDLGCPAILDEDEAYRRQELAERNEEHLQEQRMAQLDEQRRDRISVVPGVTLNGNPVYQDNETGDIVDEFGNPKNENDPYVPGEVIMFAMDRYEVVENFGDSGTVKALDDGGTIVTGFRWVFEGEKCRRLNSCEALQLLDGVRVGK